MIESLQVLSIDAVELPGSAGEAQRSGDFREVLRRLAEAPADYLAFADTEIAACDAVLAAQAAGFARPSSVGVLATPEEMAAATGGRSPLTGDGPLGGLTGEQVLDILTERMRASDRRAALCNLKLLIGVAVRAGDGEPHLGLVEFPEPSRPLPPGVI